MYECMYACMNVYMYIIYVCMHVCMCVSECMHTYIAMYIIIMCNLCSCIININIFIIGGTFYNWLSTDCCDGKWIYLSKTLKNDTSMFHLLFGGLCDNALS